MISPRCWLVLVPAALFLPAAGCVNSPEINPFLTLSEDLGLAGATTEGDGQGGSVGESLGTTFRREMTVTFRNNNQNADLVTTFVAWVNAGSIRSAEQQDLLLSDGYVQIGKEIQLGTAHRLPVGTFVYGGTGTAGATAIRLRAAGAGATTDSITLLTPDVILVFYHPPVSCDSAAFAFTDEGEVITSEPIGGGLGPFGGANTTGGFKTLAQVDVYECNPLHPGLFIKLGGGVKRANEYFEGEDVTFDISEIPDAGNNFCFVTVGDAP